jgi:predicted  nucleic acid-binding Zn-ribbon protein
VSEPRPEQRPAADRIYRRWGDIHRINHLDNVLRRVAFQAAKFDSTPSPDELKVLAAYLDKAEEAIAELQRHLEDLASAVHELAGAVSQIEADRDAGKSEWGVFGFADDDDMLERLARIYKLDSKPSQNRLNTQRFGHP